MTYTHTYRDTKCVQTSSTAGSVQTQQHIVDTHSTTHHSRRSRDYSRLPERERHGLLTSWNQFQRVSEGGRHISHQKQLSPSPFTHINTHTHTCSLSHTHTHTHTHSHTQTLTHTHIHTHTRTHNYYHCHAIRIHEGARARTTRPPSPRHQRLSSLGGALVEGWSGG